MSWITTSQVDAKFRDSILSSDLSIADGMPLVWVARLLGLPIQRIAGSDLFETLMEGAAGQLTVFFLEGLKVRLVEHVNTSMVQTAPCDVVDTRILDLVPSNR